MSRGALIEPVEFQPRRPGRSRPSRRLRPAVVLLWLAAVAVAAAAWQVLTVRSVELRVEPAPDRLAVRGTLLPLRLGGRHLLRPGDYSLAAEKAGYRRLEATLEVTSEPSQILTFTLERLPGRLAVETVDGATVAIDGEEVGVTPLAALELDPGDYEVEIRAERYRAFAARVTIDGAGSTRILSAELEPLWAEVTFDSEPRGATVSIDGEAVGTTPVTAEVLEGERTVTWRLAGYKPRRRQLEVAAGVPETVPAVRLQVVDGNLVLRSAPAAATVTVDGVYQGTTPLDLYLSPGEPHEINVSKAGYEPRSQEVRVASGESRELRLDLSPQMGELEIQSWPPDADLYVDGEPRGRASQTLRLRAVPHQIEIRKAGYSTYRDTLTPLPGVPQAIEVRLQSRQEARAEATPAVLRSAEGHELRLIAPGRFRMGASRREPGRRANETLREVELTRPFYLATQEVSNRQLRRFKKDHLSGQAAGHNLEIDHHPAVRVTWEDAALYCNWLSRQESLPPVYERKGGTLVAIRPLPDGYRLPTEAEWAWAARYPGGSGREALKYPWGSSLPIAPDSGNYADASADGLLPTTLAGYRDGFPATAPVDSFEPDARGLYNLGGNVAEWVQDAYAVYPPSAAATLARDPLGAEEGEHHVIRGASWMHGNVTRLRLTYRDYGAKARPDVGFRIARNAQ